MRLRLRRIFILLFRLTFNVRNHCVRPVLCYTEAGRPAAAPLETGPPRVCRLKCLDVRWNCFRCGPFFLTVLVTCLGLSDCISPF